MLQLLSCRRGSAAVEMALVLPFLIILLFGSVELGYYFYNQHQIVKGVRDGARFASRQPFTSLGCGGAALDTQLISDVKRLTLTGLLSGGQPRVAGWSADDINVTVSCSTGVLAQSGLYRDEGTAPQILVTTTVDYIPLFGGLGVINSNFTLNASQQAAGMGL